MATKKKKVVSKDDLRRLMKEKQTISKSTSKKIEHPLAKYNSLDQLTCSLCNTVVKSALVWPAHLQSKTHKLNIENLKRKQDADTAPLKRKLPYENESVGAKKLKGSENGNSSNSGGLPSDFFDSSNSTFKKPSTTAAIKTGKPLLSGYGSSDSEDDADTTTTTAATKTSSSSSSSSLAAVSGLPADFFDHSITASTSSSKDTVADQKPTKISDALPEGFFDDPKMDAKIREVEYVDKMEEEWELFQKSMKEEAHVSEAIVEEEDEQVNVDRNIDEIDEQIQCWKEVNDLETKKEEIMKNGPVETKNDNDSDEDLNEEMLDEFLDWRSKKSWR